MAFRVDGVSFSYSQWQRSCCCGDHSVGKLGPGRVCAVALRRGSVTGLQPDRERKLMVIEILDNILYSGYCAITPP